MPINEKQQWSLPSQRDNKAPGKRPITSIVKSLQLAEEDLIQGLNIMGELEHLHGCEQEGLSSGQPTPAMWYEATNKLTKYLDKFRGE